MLKKVIILYLCLFFSAPVLAEYRTFNYQGATYGVFEARPENVSLHWKNKEGKAYAFLRNLKSALEQRHQIKMLMNAGIYSKDDEPAGLWIENGEVLRPLNIKKGKGNFHIQPNGVFFITEGRARILTSEKYRQSGLTPLFAVQSGPMLIIDGRINPQFKASLHSPYRRNAVCMTQSGKLYFINTVKGASNLYFFSQALSELKCHNALYLDGSISSWYIPGQFSVFHWHYFVGMIAVTE